MERSARAGALASAVLHAAVAGALLSHETARTALLAATPIMVDWIVPPAAELVPHAPPPRAIPGPRPIVAAPVAETPVLSTPAAAVPAETPQKVEEPPTAVVAAPVAPTAPESAPVATPVATPVAFSPPEFNAAYLDNAPPPYPYISRRTGEQGRVVLRVQVSASGTAEDVEVRSTSGHARLDQAALEAVRHWKFVPARRGATPVPASVLVPVSFRLEG